MISERAFDYALRQYLAIRAISKAILESGEVRPNAEYIATALEKDGVARHKDAARTCRELAVARTVARFYLDEDNPGNDIEAREVLHWLKQTAARHNHKRWRDNGGGGRVSMETFTNDKSPASPRKRPPSITRTKLNNNASMVLASNRSAWTTHFQTPLGRSTSLLVIPCIGVLHVNYILVPESAATATVAFAPYRYAVACSLTVLHSFR